MNLIITTVLPNFSIFHTYKLLKKSYEMFVRMLTVHCNQNNSYEITINGFQVRKINGIRKRFLTYFIFLT